MAASDSESDMESESSYGDYFIAGDEDTPETIGSYQKNHYQHSKIEEACQQIDSLPDDSSDHTGKRSVAIITQFLDTIEATDHLRKLYCDRFGKTLHRKFPEHFRQNPNQYFFIGEAHSKYTGKFHNVRSHAEEQDLKQQKSLTDTLHSLHSDQLLSWEALIIDIESACPPKTQGDDGRLLPQSLHQHQSVMTHLYLMSQSISEPERPTLWQMTQDIFQHPARLALIELLSSLLTYDNDPSLFTDSLYLALLSLSEEQMRSLHAFLLIMIDKYRAGDPRDVYSVLSSMLKPEYRWALSKTVQDQCWTPFPENPRAFNLHDIPGNLKHIMDIKRADPGEETMARAQELRKVLAGFVGELHQPDTDIDTYHNSRIVHAPSVEQSTLDTMKSLADFGYLTEVGRAFISRGTLKRYPGLFTESDIGKPLDLEIILRKMEESLDEIQTDLKREMRSRKKLANRPEDDNLNTLKLPHCEAAKRLIIEMKEDYAQHGQSKRLAKDNPDKTDFEVTIREAAALFFLAFHARGDFRDSSISRRTCLEAFFMGLYAYRRGENLSSNDVDNGDETDKSVCPEGLITNMCMRLSLFNPKAKVILITPQTVSENFPIRVRTMVEEYSQTLSPTARARLASDITPENTIIVGSRLYNHLISELQRILPEEHPAIYGDEGMGNELELPLLLDNLEYVTLKPEFVTSLAPERPSAADRPKGKAKARKRRVSTR
ncbi:hypothetical protein [Parendozoicomonas haliclonae]|nr:hypothetical protein [Parendozoicomonas haliclonae]